MLDLSLPAFWTAWKRFRQGKQASRAIDHFQYHLETELSVLQHELASDTYRHGPYTHFETTDTKRRAIAVAKIRDRVVHRLLYDYLVRIFDKTFLADVWSCRTGKGLIGGIDRTRTEVERHREAITTFLNQRLRLFVHPTNDHILPVRRGLRFLGVHIFPWGRQLLKRTHRRIAERLAAKNRASYHGLIMQHEPAEIRILDWRILQQLEQAE